MTEPQPVLTVVVTAHRVQHLDDALASLARQTTDRFDLVCCADITSGEPVAELFADLLSAVQCREGRIIEVEGGTAGRVRNAGFAASETEWVSYLDGDDVLRADAIARVLAAVERNTADIVSTGMARIDTSGTSTVIADSLTYRPPRWIYHTDPEVVGHATFFNQFQAIRRALWTDYPFYEETNGEDIDFMLHQLLMGRFDKIPVPLYGYRDTPGSFSKMEFPERDLCTRRYESGYYRTLLAQHYRDELAANFAEPR